MQRDGDLDIGTYLLIAENWIRNPISRRRLPGWERTSDVGLRGYDWTFLGHNWAYAAFSSTMSDGDHVEEVNKQITLRNYFSLVVTSSVIFGKTGVVTGGILLAAGALATVALAKFHNDAMFAEIDDPKVELSEHETQGRRWMKDNEKSLFNGVSLINSALGAFTVKEYLITGAWKKFKWYWLIPAVMGGLIVVGDWAAFVLDQVKEKDIVNAGLRIDHRAHFLGEATGVLVSFLL